MLSSSELHKVHGDCQSLPSMVCIQRGCTDFALTCGVQSCSCRLPHSRHQMLYIDCVLERVAESMRVPQELSKLEKMIDTVIDSTIHNMEKARESHKEHIRKYMETQMGLDSLQSKLYREQQLERKEVTGNTFYRMMHELDEKDKIESPYRLPSAQAEKRLQALHVQSNKLQDKLIQLWTISTPSQFKFSPSLKHNSIVLQNQGRRASGSTADVSEATVLVQPPLPLGKTSKISFSINKLSYISLGVCYQSHLQRSGFRPNLNRLGHGTYLLYKDGHIYSDSKEDENNVDASWLTFKEGDIVNMEFDPQSGKITYMKNGANPFVHNTEIRSNTQEVVCFCAMLQYAGNDVSIV